MKTFIILDGSGNELKRAQKKISMKRFSMEAAATQRFLDSLYCAGAVEARIEQEGRTPLHFRFVQGRSQYFPNEETT